MEKLQKAFSLFDEYNKQDTATFVWEGSTYPAEYFYALQLYNWVLKLEPQASEQLLLASRSQHLGRFTIPREEYPEGKTGYLNWRSNLAKFHAEKAAEFMRQAGYDEDTITGTQRIILKQKIKLDHEVQTIENALCLVFLEFQYEDFRKKHSEDKMLHILRKTWNKMSDPGRNAALTLTYTDAGKALIGKALA